MSEMRQSIQKDEQINIDRAFWGSIILTVVGISSFVLGLFMIARDSVWQVYGVGLVATVSMLINIACVVLIRRGQAAFSLKLLFLSGLVTITLNTILLENVTTLLIGFMLLVSLGEIFFLFPKAWRNRALLGPFTAMAVMLLVEFLSPSFRFNLITVAPFFGQIMMAFMVVAFLIVVFRQTWGRSMRNKLVVAFIGVTVVATGALAVFTYTSTSDILRTDLDLQLAGHTDQIALSIGDLLHEQVTTLTTLSLNEILQQAVEESNNEYVGDAAAIQAALEEKDALWRAADAADNNAEPLVQEHLSNAVALDLIEFQEVFPEHLEVFITDMYGGLAGTTNRTSDYYQADEGWWQVAYNNGEGAVYIGSPEFDESTGKIGVQIALPLRSRETHEVVGILRTTFDATEIATVLEERLGETGDTDLFVPGEELIHYHDGKFEAANVEEFERLRAVADQGLVEMDYEGELSVVEQATVHSLTDTPYIDDLGWVVTFHQHRDEAFAPLTEGIRGLIIVSLIVVILAAVASFGLALVLVRPIIQLTQTAEEIAGGNIDTRAEVSSDDEVGTLAKAFNTMTSQLREFIGTLEQRVEARTKDLATVADISTVTSTIQDPTQMLERMVQLTQRGFNRYHAHVFIYNEDEDSLEIVACGWEEGSEHEGTHGLTSISLSAEQSLVARAARNREPVIVNDVRNEPGWLPNPQLPETRSEMAVPMFVGDKLLGVLDVQESRVDGFTEEDANIKMTLASQIAVALQNAKTYAEAEQTRQEAQSLVDYAAEGIAVIDVESVTWTAPNEQFAQIFGMTRDEIMQTGPLQMSPPAQPDGRDTSEKAEELINKTLNEGPQEFEWAHLNARGEPIDCEIHLVALPGNKPRIRQSIVDITERKRQAEETARRARHEAALNLISQKIQNAATIEEAMQITARELGRAVGKRQTLVALDPAALGVNTGEIKSGGNGNGAPETTETGVE